MDVRHDTRFVLSMNVPLRNIVDCSVISSRQVHDERKANITKSKLVSIQSMGNSTVGLNGRDEGLIVIAIVTEIQMIDAHGRREQRMIGTIQTIDERFPPFDDTTFLTLVDHQ